MTGKKAAAVDERGAVGVVEVGREVQVWRYAPAALGSLERREDFAALAERAASKLGWRRDRRCRSGWRKAGV